MNLHEYQAKELLKKYNLPVIDGRLCYTPAEVEAAYDFFQTPLCVLKAQVHAGGRGKAGGIKLVKSAVEARMVAEQMIGMKLITPQTGNAGKIVKKVYLTKACDIDREFYLSLLVDRSKRAITLIASAEGGVDIEETAAKHPEKIVKLAFSSLGPQGFEVAKLAALFGVSGELAKKLGEIVINLYKAFTQRDFSLIEINPLVLTKSGEWVLLDAKCSVDENALYRQVELKGMADYDEIDPKDLKAGKFGLSYIALEGNIGCLVNGAGLAMATMDIIKFHGGNPANFLDVGGGASKETVVEAFKILLSDSQVRGILVNIFGGIMRCDLIASGIVEAASELGVKVPLVVRLQGTNVQQGREILSKSNLRIVPADTMDEAAKKIVAAVG